MKASRRAGVTFYRCASCWALYGAHPIERTPVNWRCACGGMVVRPVPHRAACPNCGDLFTAQGISAHVAACYQDDRLVAPAVPPEGEA